MSTETNSAALRYGALFVMAHLIATLVLAGLLFLVLVRFGVLGLPGAHTLVLVGIATYVGCTFISRNGRTPSTGEFQLIFTVSAVYIICLDILLARAILTITSAGARAYAVGGLCGAILIDLLLLFIALKYISRRIMARKLSAEA